MSARNPAFAVLLTNQTLERLTGDACVVVRVIQTSRWTWGQFWREARDIVASYRAWVEYEADQAWLRYLTIPVDEARDREQGWYLIR